VLVAGRGLHALLSVLPMVLGAVYARRGGTGGRRYLRRTVAVTVPARTPGIAGERSIAELTRIDAGGHRLGALIRGVDRTAPVLLFVPGRRAAASWARPGATSPSWRSGSWW
jgi:hypothetical protein